MKRHRPTLLSPFGRAAVTAGATLVLLAGFLLARFIERMPI